VRAPVTDEKISRRQNGIQRDLAEEADLRWSGAAYADSDSPALLVPTVEFATFAKPRAKSRIDRHSRAPLGSGALGTEGKCASDYKDNAA
jgi:hypothetical protein